MSTNKSIVKSSGVISFATISSRILGFIRDILLAKFFGTGIAMQAFVIAFRIPNLLRAFLAEGVSSSVLVPVLSEYLVTRNNENFWRFAVSILKIFFIILLIVTILGIVFAPLIVQLIAPGFVHDNAKMALTIKLTKIMFPYLIFIGMISYVVAILNTFKSFAIPALSPSIFNIVLIITVLYSSLILKDPIIVLSIGVLIAGFLQMLPQIPILYSKGFKFKFFYSKINWRESGIRKTTSLFIPRIFSAAVHQINIFVDTILASLGRIVGEGAVCAIYYANRIIQFPLAIFGFALSTAILPTFSRQVAKKDISGLKHTLSFSLKNIFLLLLPSSIGILVLSFPIIEILFQRGSFDFYSTQITSWALLFYSLGLVFFGCSRILVSCFYSLQDTATPLRASLVSLIVNVVLNLILMWPLKVGGLALASSISSLINFLILYILLTKKIGRLDERQLLISFFKILIASIIMGFFVKVFWHNYLFVNPILKLLLSLLLGGVIFVIGCLMLKVSQIQILLSWVLRRK